jgi:23S rRNA (adenine2503-C2)-methyltransferase
MKIINIPTGKIIVDNYTKGELETLSIGDYGKSKNIKADFLGFTNEVNGVPNGKIVKLSEKWVMTLSTQYGCAMSCKFCDAHNVDFKGNVSFSSLVEQFFNAREVFNEIKYTDRLNIHFARMGEPTFNYKNVFEFTKYLMNYKRKIQKTLNLRIETLHPVFTTMMPKNIKNLDKIISGWCDIKNNLYNGQAGLQISINTTNEEKRNYMFNNKSLSLDGISEICKKLETPIGRKYCLNFAITNDTEIDPIKLSNLFDKDNFMVKITPIHNNKACKKEGFKTINGYDFYFPYKKIEDDLKNCGWDVLVFVPSLDEENGAVTCGNAILGGSDCKFLEIMDI